MSIFSPTFFQELKEVDGFEISEVSYGHGFEEALIQSPKIGFGFKITGDGDICYSGVIFFLNDSGEKVFELDEQGDKNISSLTVGSALPDMVRIGGSNYRNTGGIDQTNMMVHYALEGGLA